MKASSLVPHILSLGTVTAVVQTTPPKQKIQDESFKKILQTVLK